MPNFLSDSDAIVALKNCYLLSGLGEAVLRDLLPDFKLERWPKGTLVMSPRQTATRFYVLLDGRVRIEAVNPHTGRSLTLYLLTGGDTHSLVSLLDGKRHEVQADTMDEVEAMSASLARWRKWLETYPSVRLAAFRGAAQLLRDLSDLAEDLALHETSARLAHQILRHLDSESGEINLIGDLVHEDLARLIGSVRVVVNRLINHFKREGIIHTKAGSLRVANLEGLLQKAERSLERWNAHDSGE